MLKSYQIKIVQVSEHRKEDFATVFTDITRRGMLPQEASIHTAEMRPIKIAFKEIHKRWEI